MFKALAMACGLGCAMLPACSSSSGSGACGTISGNYSDSVTVSSPSAPSCVLPGPASGAVTITGPGPDHNVTLPSIQGSCPATSSGCSLDVQCHINVTDSSGNPAGSANLTAHWTFSETGFTGQSTLVLQKSDGSTCTWDLADTGAKD
jgi:hypothetical protein